MHKAASDSAVAFTPPQFMIYPRGTLACCWRRSSLAGRRHLSIATLIETWPYSGRRGAARHRLSQVKALHFAGFFVASASKCRSGPPHLAARCHGEAPTAGSMLLAASCWKLGAYGFHPPCHTVFPDVWLTEVIHHMAQRRHALRYLSVSASCSAHSPL